jgi:predicted dehydrogenase
LVGFQFRFHAALRQVKHWLQEGAVGDLIGVRAHYGDYLPAWHPWEDYHQAYSARADLGGGVILTLSHPLDYMRWLIGEVQSLWAFTARQKDLNIEVEDTAEIGLKFFNGVIGSVHLNYLQRPASHSATFVGVKGLFIGAMTLAKRGCKRLGSLIRYFLKN